MKFQVFFILLTCSLSPFCQEIDPIMYSKTWQDNEVRIINGYSITRVFGQTPHAPAANNVMPITSIPYKSLSQLENDILGIAEKEKWTEAELNKQLTALEENAAGGEIEIYVSRYAEESANFKWFFVIVRGEDDKGKLWEHELHYQAPQNPYERGWWNYTTVKLPVEVQLPFYIYFNDKQSKYLSDFKFKIDSIEC